VLDLIVSLTFMLFDLVPRGRFIWILSGYCQ